MSELVNVDDSVRAETASCTIESAPRPAGAIRLYRPRPHVLDGSWVPPVPEPVR